MTALDFRILAECSTTKARTALMKLPHSTVETPVFMPVGTQGTLKGVLTDQLESLDCRILLSNTYHLGNRPGIETLAKAGGLHKFMNWKRSLLTDSGGFQMVSLLKLSKVNEEGVEFQSPYDKNSSVLLTPEHSIEIQKTIGADIMMQLDDVVDATSSDFKRFDEATSRTLRWLDRCLKVHSAPESQNLFPIVQGGLDPMKRKDCATKMIQRDVPGFAIGGLSGGEAKDDFWKMVHVTTNILPREKPRYLMGVGYAVDLVICSALGIDMFDCVSPTRTARFGSALISKYPGSLNMKKKIFRMDFSSLEDDCECSTCTHHTRAYIHSLATKETSGCHLLSIHNVHFQLKLMRKIREAISKNEFPVFILNFMENNFPDKNYPEWIVSALKSVNVLL